MEQKKEKEIKLKAKAFLFTLFKINEWGPILEYLQSLTSRNYLLVSREFAPKTGSEHYHIYIQFKYTVTLSRKKLLSANIQICRGTPQQNIDYVKKEGDILLEEGEPRLGGGNAITIKEVKAMTSEERENLPFSSYNRLQALKRDEISILKASEYYKEVEVYYIFGKSGMGKTKYVMESIKKLADLKLIESAKYNKVKYTDKFWNGVSMDNMTQVALYDDFRDYHIPPSEFIQFIDYYYNIMNIKNSFVVNKFKYIFITSIQSPYDLYKKYQKSENIFVSNDEYAEEAKEQWLRRFTEIIEVTEKNIKLLKQKQVQTKK